MVLTTPAAAVDPNRPRGARRGLRILTGAVGLTVALALGGAVGMRAAKDAPVIFGADAGVVLTFVHPDQTEVFERIVARTRRVLQESDDLIRQQQAEAWRVFRSPDPGPNGSALYVGFMEPVLRGADYSLAQILREELPEAEAESVLAELDACLSQPQSTLDLDLVVDLTRPLTGSTTDDVTGATP